MTLDELMHLELPALEALPHEVVDLSEHIDRDPSLPTKAMTVVLPDYDLIGAFQRASGKIRELWAKDEKASQMRFVDATEIAKGEYKPPEFLVEHLIPRVGVSLLTGDVSSAKTAFSLHMALAIPTNNKVAGLFNTYGDRWRPVLYLNGEMGGADLQRYLAQAAAGLNCQPPFGSLQFFGAEGVASFGFGVTKDWRSEAFEATLELRRPCLVIFDSLRALAEIEEIDLKEVRRFFNWIRDLSNKYDCAFLFLHHLRKLSQVSNSSRERVSGSRDLLANPDIHIAVISKNGAPMHALELGKTRSPWNGVSQGTKWPVEAKLVFDSNPALPPKSLFIAHAPDLQLPHASAFERSKSEIRAQLIANGPQTRQQLAATDSSRKRAFDAMLEAGEIVEVGKDGRKKLYALAKPDAADETISE